MARTTRNSNKKSPSVMESEEELDEETVTFEGTIKSKKTNKPQVEEDESSESDDFEILEDPDKREDKRELLIQQKTDKKSDVKEDKHTCKKLGAGKEKDTKNTDEKTSPIFAVFGIMIFIVLIFVAIFFGSTPPGVHTNMQSGLTTLFHDFKNQPAKSDRKLRMRAMSYLNDRASPQPFVVMVAATADDQYAADCFANKLGKLLTSEPLVINGSLYSSIQSEKAKLEIDEKLQEAFQENVFPTVAIIHNLEMLTYDTSMLFYKYCDHEHPRYCKAAIIFTVSLPRDYHLISSTSDEVAKEGMVETYLAEQSAWAKDKEFDENKMGALLSRISDTVIVIRSESQESLQSFCNE